LSRTLVRGGTLVLPDGARPGDLLIDGESIAAIERPGVVPPNGVDRVVAADGLLVLPGVIDVHTHTRTPSAEDPDRFFQDSLAAAFGGTTTFLSFNNPGTGISLGAQGRLSAGVDEWIAGTNGESAIDYGLSAVITAQQSDPAGDLAHAIDRGVPTFKAFMVYDFGIPADSLRPMLRRVADAGGMLELHCEDRQMLDREIAGLLASGRTRPADHARSRPPTVEAAGTAEAVRWALEDDVPLYVVHLSCAAALDPARTAQRSGARVFVETCPHFLSLGNERYDGSDEAVIRYVVSPPLRSDVDRAALWEGIRHGAIQVVATDHVPDRLAVEKHYHGQPFPEISNGAPGIETLLAVAYSDGVAVGRITLEGLVDVLSGNPARLFGLPRKGALALGKDADVVLFDPFASRTIRAARLHHTSDYTPFEGMAVRGAVRHVMVRGEDVVRDGEFVGRRGLGRYQERTLAL
jgi:dihydropyrimidinase